MNYKVVLKGKTRCVVNTRREARNKIYELKKKFEIERFGWTDMIIGVPETSREKHKIWLKSEINRM